MKQKKLILKIVRDIVLMILLDFRMEIFVLGIFNQRKSYIKKNTKIF